MKLIPFLNILLIIFFALCTSKQSIKREIIPSETLETRISTENCASIITRDFEISIQELQNDQLENIFKTEAFLNKDSKFKAFHMPGFVFFKIALENIGNDPLKIGDSRISFNNTVTNHLPSEYLVNKFSQGSYSAINFGEILSLFKLDTEDLCNIDYNLDIIKYSNEEIQPGEKALKIIVFDWIPVQIRNFTLSIEIKSDISQKIIDFKLMRFEYRQSGKYFTKPEKDENY